MAHPRYILFAVASAGFIPTALPAQNSMTGIATETQERRSEGQDQQIPWDYLGLLGLAGLAGLRRHHAAPAPRN
ncbi:WGxxGxxG family protein [Sphingomonas montana]|uniref:WGxxGxxG family protein n=1 Tax=Sphingomonas montana TaxID=1843236 RepID=UPI00096E4FFD